MQKRFFPRIVFAGIAAFFLFAFTRNAVAEELTWDAGGGTWNFSSTNWLASDASGTTFSQGSAVVFGADPAQSGTIAISGTNGVRIGSSGTNPGMIVTGTGDWTFVLSTGTAANGGIGISGSGAGLRMEGAGVLTLSTTTTYTGATEIAAGTLRFGVANAIAQSSGVSLASAATLNLGGFNQTLHALHVSDGANVVFSSTEANYIKLTLGALTGTGGVFHLRTNLGAGNTDQIILTGSAGASEGAHGIRIEKYGDTPTKADTSILLVQVSGSSTATFSGTTEKDSYVYQVERGANGSWYLNNSTLMSRTAAAVVATAAASGQDWRYEMDALYKRMGELREPPLGGAGNLWLRGNASQVNVDADLTGYKYRQYVYGVTLGADKALRLGQSTLYLGGFGVMGHVKRDFEIGGKGKTDSTGGGIYATWQHETGWFADVAGRMDRYKNEINAITTDGYFSTGKYNSKVKGFSAEFGRRLLWNADWWIEPGIQYAYANIGGADYATTSDGQSPMSVSVADSRASQGRVSLRFGETNGENPGWHPYAKIAAVYSWTNGGRVRAGSGAGAREFEADFDGWRYELGFGAAYVINARSQFYYDYEYAWSSDYKRPWSVNAGYRLSW